MPNFPENKLVRGGAGFIRDQISASLPTINAEIASQLKGASAIPSFDSRVIIGEVPNTPNARFCIEAQSGPPPQQTASMGLKQASFTYRILTLIPLAGDNTPENYEILRQISLENTLSWLDNDNIALTPTIKLASLPNASAIALQGFRGRWASIFPMKMADGVTIVRGWDVLYTLTFNVAYGMVLDA